MARAIYKIRNTVNSKFYVGSSIDTRIRFKSHKKLLRRGTHHSSYLQNAWNKYGEDAFSFDVVRIVRADEDMEVIEDEWLAEHVGKKYCYNVGRSSKAPWRGVTGEATSNYGKRMSDAQKQKISESLKKLYNDPNYRNPRKGKKHSSESRAKISAGIRQAVAEGRAGCFIPTAETRQKMSESLKGNQNCKGFKHDTEFCEKSRQNALGNQHWLGRHHTDESRAKTGRPIVELTTGKEFAVMTDAARFYGMPNLATILRSIKTGLPASKGPNAGLFFAYADDRPEYVPGEYPTTRPEAKSLGAKHYFTGKPCKRGHMALRVLKGSCVECLKEDWQRDNDKRKGQPKSAASKAAGQRYYLRNKELVIDRAKRQHVNS